MRCAHFDEAGLARQEAGLPDPHADDCTDCQAARATYQKLTEALADVHVDLAPRAGWEDEVLAKVRAESRAASGPAAGRGRRWLAAGVGGALLAAAIVLLVVGARPRPTLVASVDKVPSGAVTRSADEAWSAGDNIWAISEPAGAVWIYRGERLVLACDGASLDPPRCVPHGRGVRAWEETRVGVYRVLVFDRAAPGSAPATYDEAKALLARAGDPARERTIDVR